LLLRLNPADSDAKLARLREVLRQHSVRLPNSFVVVDAGKMRIRPLANP